MHLIESNPIGSYPIGSDPIAEVYRLAEADELKRRARLQQEWAQQQQTQMRHQLNHTQWNQIQYQQHFYQQQRPAIADGSSTGASQYNSGAGGSSSLLLDGFLSGGSHFGSNGSNRPLQSGSAFLLVFVASMIAILRTGSNFLTTQMLASHRIRSGSKCCE